MFLILALVHLGCMTSTRRKETRVRWEDTFGESKTAMEKVHWRNALGGPYSMNTGTFSTGTTDLSNQTGGWPVLVPGGRHGLTGEDLGGVGGTHGQTGVLSQGAPNSFSSTLPVQD